MSAGSKELESYLRMTQSNYGDTASKGIDRIRALFEQERDARELARSDIATWRAKLEQSEAQVAAIVAAAEAYKDDPVNALDRPQSWSRLQDLLDIITDPASATAAREYAARVRAEGAMLAWEHANEDGHDNAACPICLAERSRLAGESYSVIELARALAKLAEPGTT